MPASRLSPLDAAFLEVESPTAHMHVGWAAVYAPPQNAPRPSFEQLRDHVAARLPRAPRYRQMLRPVPLAVNSPVWADDPDFDVRRHVRLARGQHLTEVIDRCMSEPLARSRPLWELRIAPRLEDGRIGVVGKVHHCMVDGIAAVELASLLLDPEPDPPPPEPDGWAPAPQPEPTQLLFDAALDLIRRELGPFSRLARETRSPQRAQELVRQARRALGALGSAARPAPRAVLNRPISPRRHLALLARPLEDLLRVKRAYAVKLNDVLLAVCAGAVRSFLIRRGSEATRLKTMVPVNVRGAGWAGELGNRISFMFVDLPCDEPSPVRRLREVHAATWRRKQAGEPEGAEAVLAALALAPPPVQRRVARLMASPRTFNLTVSNIPGPSEPLFMRGCRLEEAYPVVPIPDWHGLAIGLTTIGDRAFFGLYADRGLIPEADALAACIDMEINALIESAPRRRFDPSAAPVPAG